jgi:hypothetical protein
MKKLEEEIRAAFKAKGVTATREDLSKAAAEVSKRYIEKAFEDGRKFEHAEHFGRVPNPCLNKDQWIKDIE